jgi:hypothetical protein
MKIGLDLISADRISSMTRMEKIRLILDTVQMGNIIVLERGLTPKEEATLIEATMNEISSEFTGIEIESYPYKHQGGLRRFFGKQKPPLTLIGPADKLKMIKKDDGLISAVVSTRFG